MEKKITIYKASVLAINNVKKLGTYMLPEIPQVNTSIQFDGELYTVLGVKHAYDNPYGQAGGNLSNYELTVEIVIIETSALNNVNKNIKS